MDYKKLMILHYFNNVKAGYSYQELMTIFGLQEEQLQVLLTELTSQEFLKMDGYYKLTLKGEDELKNKKIENDKFDEFELGEIFVERYMSIDEIYIPEKFEKSFKYNFK